ncbi:coiled-coil domain-containing protein 15 isoform X2 [Mastacembelus armatus]|uniref:Coiled-coil domain containing 15 n=1 Tax=Mastacembelus armatus TaxID=205130 RepID=A0A3Q3NAW0_9TELE|nr:coiled-coil domain-containing protein 15 isoform X2 [Mastacembelus armatus]
MSANRVIASTGGRNKAPVSRSREHRPLRPNKVLAERNQAVVAVGAWVEDGQDFPEHPSALALLTEELQAEKRRENEESLQRFQDEVRHRVAQRVHVYKKRQQPQTETMVKADSRIPQQFSVWTQHVSAGENLMTVGGAARQRLMKGSCHESSEGMSQVRLRLAACRMSPVGEMTSDPPEGKWNIQPARHESESHVLRAEREVEEEVEDVQEEDEDEEGNDHLLTSQHECPRIQRKVSGCVLWDTEKSQSDPGFKSSLTVPQLLWPLTDQELKRQRQSQFLMQRRLFMNTEREQVKENKQHRKHLKRTARIKAEKEQIRLEEEKKLERVRQLTEARQKLEERELLILERLKLEEGERVMELQWRRREEKEKVATRFIEALRARMKERLSQEKLELPPLCCCASSFWDSHPDTCANNCVFHNNPKAYAQALHSTLLNLDLQ